MDRWSMRGTVGDWLPAVVLALAYGFETVVLNPGDITNESGDPGPNRPIVALVVGLGFAISLAWRRRWPVVPLGFALATALAATPRPIDASVAYVAATMLATYSAAAYARGSMAPAAALTVAVLAVVLAIQEPDWTEDYGDPLTAVILTGGPYLAGLALRLRGDREAELRRRSELLAAQRDAQESAAVEAERARIARELHDVVAHAISVIVLQARGARRALTDRPDAAREALDAIESTGSEALTEMRRLLGILRATEERADLAPRPGLRDVETLVRQVTEAGLPVALTIEGSSDELPPGVDLSIYRVVQEALTNALRHAGPASATVIIRRGPDEVEVEVADTGTGPSGDTGGRGLAGMRERVSLFGGRLVTTAPDGGGFTVRATFPLGDERP